MFLLLNQKSKERKGNKKLKVSLQSAAIDSESGVVFPKNYSCKKVLSVVVCCYTSAAMVSAGETRERKEKLDSLFSLRVREDTLWTLNAFRNCTIYHTYKNQLAAKGLK